MGERPLLIVLATINSTTNWVNGPQYYHDFVFGNSPFLFDQNGNTIKSISAFYSEMSHSRFTWKPTSPSVVEVTLTPSEATSHLGIRRNNILKRLHDDNLFDFTPYLRHGIMAIELDLGVVVFDNGSVDRAQTGIGSYQWGIQTDQFHSWAGVVLRSLFGRSTSLLRYYCSRWMSHHGARQQYTFDGATKASRGRSVWSRWHCQS